MSCWCYSCNLPVDPTPETLCPRCHEDYIEYEDSISPTAENREIRPPRPQPQTTHFNFVFNTGGDNIINMARNMGAEGGINTVQTWIHEWFQGILQNRAGVGPFTFMPRNEGDGRQMGDFFMGTEEQMQALADRLLRMSEQSLGSPPTASSFVDNLKVVKYTEGASVESTCSICLEELAVDSDVLILPCRHGFHPDCLRPWLNMHSECPCCRHELPS